MLAVGNAKSMVTLNLTVFLATSQRNALVPRRLLVSLRWRPLRKAFSSLKVSYRSLG